ncbi:hypothetical protein L208DRAFT_1390023 [Tricholoma matsutake]|nr:hypothetical protein L208DRAFT_1390023 [Tricholoma matsutake 945]
MAQYLSVKESNVLTTIIKLIRRYKDSPHFEHDTWPVKAETLIQTIGSMSNVREFSLCSSPMSPVIVPRLRDLKYFLRTAVNSGWATFGSTLRSLTLNLSLEGYRCVLTPTLLFPNLEALSITLSELINLRDDSDSKLVHDLLVPFINIHHSSLQSLKLVLHIDVSSCLLRIRHLPRLQTLDYYCGLSSRNINNSGLQHILQTHSNELRELSLSFGFPFPGKLSSGWYTQKCFSVALPHLQSITLGSGCWWDLGLTAAWLQNFNKSLTCLILDRWRFSFQEVETIVNVFTGPGLHSLYLSVHQMTPELVDMLERKLPWLIFLQLRFTAVCTSESSEFVSWNEDKLFCQVMRDRLYSNWKLRHFIAQFTGLPYKLRSDTLVECEAAIGIALPGLQTLRVEEYAKV